MLVVANNDHNKMLAPQAIQEAMITTQRSGLSYGVLSIAVLCIIQIMNDKKIVYKQKHNQYTNYSILIMPTTSKNKVNN